MRQDRPGQAWGSCSLRLGSILRRLQIAIRLLPSHPDKLSKSHVPLFRRLLVSTSNQPHRNQPESTTAFDTQYIATRLTSPSHVPLPIINLPYCCAALFSLFARRKVRDNKHVLSLVRLPSLPIPSKLPIVRPKYSSCTSAKTEQSRGQPSKYTCRKPTLASSPTSNPRSIRQLRG